MKTFIKSTLILFMLVSAFTTNVFAQKGRFGATPEDSVTCVRAISFIRDEIRQKNFETAYELFTEIMKVCPQASQNAYLYGIQIMQNFANTSTDEVQKQKYVDTLLMLYDKRYEIFGKPSKGETADRKAAELLNYRPNEHAEIVKECEIAIKENYKISDSYAQIMQQVKFMYQKGQLDGDATIAKYESLIKDIDKLPTNEDKETAKKTIEGIFFTLQELNSCESLIAMYTPKFEANPEDMDLIRAIRYRLSTTENCKDNKLFSDVVEAGYRIEPNAESAFSLAQLFYIKGDKDKFMSYMNEAMDMEKDPLAKSKYMLQVANINLSDGRISAALSLARQAANLNSNAGEAYMIIGHCYAKMAANASDCDFGGRAIFWVVVDQFQKAKSVDSSLASSANSAIYTYSKAFPTYNDIFLNEYSVGQSYSVNCNGVVGTTIIREATK